MFWKRSGEGMVFSCICTSKRYPRLLLEIWESQVSDEIDLVITDEEGNRSLNDKISKSFALRNRWPKKRSDYVIKTSCEHTSNNNYTLYGAGLVIMTYQTAMWAKAKFHKVAVDNEGLPLLLI